MSNTYDNDLDIGPVGRGFFVGLALGLPTSWITSSEIAGFVVSSCILIAYAVFEINLTIKAKREEEQEAKRKQRRF